MVLSLIKGMDKAIFQNDVCFLSLKGSLGNEFEKETEVYYLKYGNVGILKVITKLFWLLKRNRYDIIHIYGLRANIIGRIIGKMARCKIIIGGLRDKYPSDSKSMFNIFLDKLTLPFIRCYISNSKASCDFLTSLGYPKDKFRVVHNGISSSEIEKISFKNIRKDMGISDDFPIITTVANLKPKKGYNFLIEALKILSDKNLDFFALFVGEGNLKDEIERCIFTSSLSKRVFLLGKRDDVYNILLSSDIFVLPSLWEGMPVSVMEACLSHLPIIAFNVGGIPELVINSETGILVSSGDVSGLAKAIEILLVSKEKRKKMGEAGYNRIKTEFSLKKMVKGIGDIYLELIKRSNYGYCLSLKF